MENSEIYDLAVLGGGIAGAGIAQDAAHRGIRTILFEKNTFGSGTSSKSSRLIHGGLRYLETAWEALKCFRLFEFWKNLSFVFLSLCETHLLHRLYPELIKPIHLLLPIYQTQKQNRHAIYFGAWFYGLLAKISGGPHGAKILWNQEAVLRLAPNLRAENLTGGVLVWDHTTHDLHLVKAIMAKAEQAGAQLLEHAEVERYRFLKEQNLYEIKAQISHLEKKFYARKIVNATGAWIDHMREASGDYDGDWIVPVAGAHLTLPRFTDYSIILQAHDGRIFFVINENHEARIGTTERLHGDPDRVFAEESDIQYLLNSLTYYFPSQNLKRDSILGMDAGIRPLARPKNAVSVHHISREHQILQSPSGVLHVAGVKLTDHRRAAEEVVNRVEKMLPKNHRPDKNRT